MIIELNIRLDSPLRTRNSELQIVPTLRTLRERIAPGQMDYVYITRIGQSVRYKGVENQDILVVRMDADILHSTMCEVLFDVCLSLNQLCVAFFYPQVGRGGLAGPDTSAYAPFDSSKFIMYGEATE